MAVAVVVVHVVIAVVDFPVAVVVVVVVFGSNDRSVYINSWTSCRSDNVIIILLSIYFTYSEKIGSMLIVGNNIKSTRQSKFLK